MLIKRLKLETVGGIREIFDRPKFDNESYERLLSMDRFIAHLKKHRKKYLCLVCALAVLLFVFTPETVVECLAYAEPPKGLDRAKLNTFNEMTIGVLTKVYAAICMGGVAVETVAGGWQNEKKVSSLTVKYGICYAGGLLCISILNMLRLMI